MSIIWDEEPKKPKIECEIAGRGGLSIEQIEANMEKLRQNIIRNVEEEPGWSAIGVFGEVREDGERKQPFTYTIGLEKNFNHPELIIYGVEAKLAHGLIRCAVDLIKEGTQFIPGQRYDQIMQEPYLMEARDHPSGAPLNWANSYYGYDPQVIQLLWPDEKGLFENEEGFDEGYKGHQEPQVEE